MSVLLTRLVFAASSSLGCRVAYEQNYLQIDKNQRYWPAICGVTNDILPNYEQAEEGNKFKRTLLQLSIKVAQQASVVPEALIISGVTLRSKEPMGGGTFADIYMGNYQGRQVAVKKLRISMIETPEGRMKVDSALCSS